MQNSSIAFGINTVESYLNDKPGSISKILIIENSQSSKLKALLNQARKHGIRIQQLDKKSLGELCQSSKHQGIAIEIKRAKYSENDLHDLLENTAESQLILILDCIQDPHNLGACIRSANAANVDAVIVPKDKSAPITATVEKVASGGTVSTPIIPVTNLARVIEMLQQENFFVYGLAGEIEQSIFETELTGKVVLVMGSEGSGIRPLIKKKCDVLVKIPMAGTVESLNVSVATGIALFEYRRQNFKN